MALSENDLLSIELRNRGNEDVRLLLLEIRDHQGELSALKAKLATAEDS